MNTTNLLSYEIVLLNCKTFEETEQVYKYYFPNSRAPGIVANLIDYIQQYSPLENLPLLINHPLHQIRKAVADRLSYGAGIEVEKERIVNGTRIL